jgi:hypothetical protein
MIMTDSRREERIVAIATCATSNKEAGIHSPASRGTIKMINIIVTPPQWSLRLQFRRCVAILTIFIVPNLTGYVDYWTVIP